jgi:ATP-dependent DNA ligase
MQKMWRQTMIKPMLCEPSPPFNSDEYFWEIKMDGERAILIFNNGTMEIQGRKGNIVTYRYPELQALRVNYRGVISMREIVAKDESGRSNFNLLCSEVTSWRRSLILNSG